MAGTEALVGAEDAQGRSNNRLWARADLVQSYATRSLRPVEVMLLVRYRESLTGRVLELGCGAGRLTGYLAAIASDAHGIDISPAMVAHCRRAYPQASFSEGDLRDLSAFDAGSFDTVVGSFNILDVFGDHDRHAVLDELHRVLVDDGMLIMSSHNRGYAHRVQDPLRLRNLNALMLAVTLVRMPRWLRNRRRLIPLERHEPGYAILNDEAHNFSVLHYYISRDAMERQLAEHGFELLECLDLDFRPVHEDDEARDCPELHYVARRITL